MTVFYCIYQLAGGVFYARILYLCEMYVSAYLMGYFQVYVLKNFDEAEKLGIREAVSILGCTAAYTAVSAVCGWFDGNLRVTGYFGGFLILCYLCVFIINKLKREIDTDKLNSMLVRFKQEECKWSEGEGKELWEQKKQ